MASNSSCKVDKSTPPWFNDFEAVQQNTIETMRLFTLAVITPPGKAATRAELGGQAMRRLKRMRDLLKQHGEEEFDQQIRWATSRIFTIASQCGWGKTAIKYARKNLAHPSCDADRECYCLEAANIVTYLRKVRGEASAERFFSASVVPRCPYTNALQMPTPVVSFAPWIETKAFWEPSDFALGRLILAHRDDLLRELRPLARRREGLWKTYDAESIQQADAGLVQSGYWRQVSLFRGIRTWNETVCAAMPTTCGLLLHFNSTDDGARELGGKCKFYELGGRSSLRPHFGTNNVRLLLHFLVSGSSESTLRVSRETHRWSHDGEVVVFDDSFEHEVRNDADSARFVLSIQLMHPNVGAGTVDSNGKWIHAPPAGSGHHVA